MNRTMSSALRMWRKKFSRSKHCFCISHFHSSLWVCPETSHPWLLTLIQASALLPRVWMHRDFKRWQDPLRTFDCLDFQYLCQTLFFSLKNCYLENWKCKINQCGMSMFERQDQEVRVPLLVALVMLLLFIGILVHLPLSQWPI